VVGWEGGRGGWGWIWQTILRAGEESAPRRLLACRDWEQALSLGERGRNGEQAVRASADEVERR
jgi:hypothetical protein